MAITKYGEGSVIPEPEQGKPEQLTTVAGTETPFTEADQRALIQENERADAGDPGSVG